MHVYDVIVVGSRCAGAPTAMLAARAGYRVLLLERARFPKDTVSTHLIHQPGVARLARWGVLDAVIATGCPPIEQATYQVGDVRLQGSSVAVDGQRAAYAPRRDRLDQTLTDAAIKAGAEFLDGCAVIDLLWTGARVCGVRFRTAAGPVCEARSWLVVGADGMRSSVARRVGAGLELADPTLTCVYYAYWSGLPACFQLYEASGGFVGLIPTNDDLTVVAAYFPQLEFDEVRRDVRGAYLGCVWRLVPSLAGLERFGKVYGSGDQRNFFRQAAGPGWVLVGDAGHHKDSITAHGISDAFKQVDLLAEHVLPYVDDPAALDEAGATYGRLRDEALTESYYNTLSVARLDVQEDRLRLLRACSRDPLLTDRYFSVVSGAVSVEQLFTDDLLAEPA